MLGGFVVPDGGGEGEDALEDPGADAGFGAAAVAFEVELGFQCLVDRLDDLSERFEVAAAGAGCLRFQVRSDQGDAGLVEFVLEAGPPVALVGDEGAAVGVEFSERGGDA